ncbi:hypothetical protein QFC19_008750 [Naganishia cerealis]|uniref:Uncharacterized protein n=1 Tax=Naganishia cerealis TaxID=610337 RepID=A0ACC2UZY2_9TREE|nr:hypothetical protein QFC19_008750 [Naganishia cerealis]
MTSSPLLPAEIQPSRASLPTVRFSSRARAMTLLSHPAPPAEALASLPPPPVLPPPVRLLVALATLSAAAQSPAFLPSPSASATPAWRKMAQEWARAVHHLLPIEAERLPRATPASEQVISAADAHWADLADAEERREEQNKVVYLLVLASVFQPPTEGEEVTMVDVKRAKDALGSSSYSATAASSDDEKTKIRPPAEDTVPTLSYTPPARLLIYTTLHLLRIPASPLLPTIEHQLAASLFAALQSTTTTTSGDTTSTSAVESARVQQAQGWGGSTGRWLATGAGALIGGVALGLTGGLAAPAIAALVPGFMTFGLLTTASAPLVLGSVFGIAGGGLTSRRVRERWRGVDEFEFVDVKVGSEEVVPALEAKRGGQTDEAGEKESEEGKRAAGDKLSEVKEGEGKASAQRETAAPSLIATIVVPGLLTKSRTEALQAWQSTIVPSSPALSDGRDIYVLKYETAHMLQTGKAIDAWVTNKVKGYVKKEIIKRTVLSAYFTAVALPMSVYNMASLGLDNTWVQSQDKAIKAGRLLGEVLENRVQGQRPVVLIGSSLGALTVLHALLYLSSRANKSSPTALPQIVDSAFLISLPSAPSSEEWQACRQVVARRLVNAWCEKDLVLAGIVRLHEVFSRAVTLQNGVYVAGLRAVKQPGVEDVDLSDVIEGHLDLQRQMGEVLRVIRIDE